MKMKKYLLVVSMLAVMFALAGCGQEKKDDLEYDKAQITLDTLSYFEKYAAVDSEYTDYYLSDGTDFEKSAIKGIDQARNNDKVGEFQNFEVFLLNYDKTTFNPELVEAKFDESGDSVTVTVTNKAKNRDVEISVKYSENPQYYITCAELASDINVDTAIQYIEYTLGVTVEDFLANTNFNSVEEYVQYVIDGQLQGAGISQFIPEEMVVSCVYSKSELMKQAGVNTLIGMGTVFVVLIFISFIISLFKFLPALTAKKAKVPEPKKEAPNANVAAPAKKNDENLMNDAELVAVITAAIYAASASEGSTAISKDRLVVRSIKRAKR